VLALAACACARSSAPLGLAPPLALPEAHSPAFRDQLLAAVHRSADYLARACGEDGRFLYRVDVKSGRVLGGYNILRHAGAMYALAQYQASWPRPQVKAALLRAARYLRREHMLPVGDMLPVWSEPRRREAKLGGAGLALMALGEIERVAPGTTSQADLAALARFIAFMQKPDGSFYSKYFSGGGRDDGFVSLYYPGEAALGMLVIDERSVALKALLALAKARRGHDHVPADHWALLATARLPLRLPLGEIEERDALMTHGVQVAESILAERVAHPAGSPLAGCFGEDGRTTPTATRLEGLLALLPLLPAEHPLRARIQSAADQGVAFLLRAQVRRGLHRGAIPASLTSHEARIDYTQHALSAWMQYLHISAAAGS